MVNTVKNSNSGLIVRRAEEGDIDGIMDVAVSVGNASKVHNDGFLMDDYEKDYDYFKDKFLGLMKEIENFYVISDDKILGFLIAYYRNEWLKYTPGWIQDVVWSPDFDKRSIENFILIDKTAVRRELTGRGLGSELYKILIENVKKRGIKDMFAETLISPVPNFASLNFRIKQKYKLVGIRYEEYKDETYTDLIYHKGV